MVKLNIQEAKSAYAAMTPGDFITYVTDSYLDQLGGTLTAENMDEMNAHQHSLLAYRYVLDEVMEGGFIQLIQNGYAPYVLEGPFPIAVKKLWGMKDFSKFLFDVKKAYHHNLEAFEQDLSDEDFMALYEQLEDLNDLGDDFLDDYQEKTTPQIARLIIDNPEWF